MYTRSYVVVLLRARLPFEVKNFTVSGESFRCPQRFFSTARRLLKRRKKASTCFYKKREHTAEYLKVDRDSSFSPFFLIFILPTKITSFFMKDIIDHTYKVYRGIEHQTLVSSLVFSSSSPIRVWWVHLGHA